VTVTQRDRDVCPSMNCGFSPIIDPVLVWFHAPVAYTAAVARVAMARGQLRYVDSVSVAVCPQRLPQKSVLMSALLRVC